MKFTYLSQNFVFKIKISKIKFFFLKKILLPRFLGTVSLTKNFGKHTWNTAAQGCFHVSLTEKLAAKNSGDRFRPPLLTTSLATCWFSRPWADTGRRTTSANLRTTEIAAPHRTRGCHLILTRRLRLRAGSLRLLSLPGTSLADHLRPEQSLLLFLPPSIFLFSFLVFEGN